MTGSEPGEQPAGAVPPGPSPPGGWVRPGWFHRRGPWYRGLAGAAVGGGLALVAMLTVLLGARAGLASHLSCNHQQPWGCLGLAIAGLGIMQVTLVLLPWPLLHAAGVRPAWQPALLAVLARVVIYLRYGMLLIPLHSAVWFVVLPALTYGAAAVATASGAPRRWRLLAGAFVLVGCPLLTGWLSGFVG